jgi:hypothetical protein
VCISPSKDSALAQVHPHNTYQTNEDYLAERKLSTETPVCHQERLVIISYMTGLSFALERIGPLAAITIIVFYLLALYLFDYQIPLKTRLLVLK